MGAFIKASNYTSHVTTYNSEIKELQTGKGYADAAKAVGNTIVSSLNKLLDLATQYAATSDANVQAPPAFLLVHAAPLFEEERDAA